MEELTIARTRFSRRGVSCYKARVLHMFSYLFFSNGLAHLSNYTQKVRIAIFHDSIRALDFLNAVIPKNRRSDVQQKLIYILRTTQMPTLKTYVSIIICIYVYRNKTVIYKLQRRSVITEILKTIKKKILEI